MTLDHLALLATDAEAFSVAVETGPADAPIAGCPGWRLPELGAHLGGVHRWARAAIITGAVPQLDPAADPAPSELGQLAVWLREGAARLLATLHDLDPQRPTWHPFPVEPKVAGLWRRRQAQEASVHRWDAQRAVGQSPSIDAEFAADGIDEYWTVMLPRLITREHLVVPSTTFAAETTDTGQRWVVHGGSGRVEIAAPGVEPAACIRGDAQHVLLSLWGRPVPANAVSTSGDPAVADSWLALGGA